MTTEEKSATVEDDRPCERPARRWSDDTEDWYGCTLPEAAQLNWHWTGWNVEKSLASTAQIGHKFS